MTGPALSPNPKELGALRSWELSTMSRAQNVIDARGTRALKFSLDLRGRSYAVVVPEWGRHKPVVGRRPYFEGAGDCREELTSLGVSGAEIDGERYPLGSSASYVVPLPKGAPYDALEIQVRSVISLAWFRSRPFGATPVSADLLEEMVAREAKSAADGGRVKLALWYCSAGWSEEAVQRAHYSDVVGYALVHRDQLWVHPEWGAAFRGLYDTLGGGIPHSSKGVNEGLQSPVETPQLDMTVGKALVARFGQGLTVVKTRDLWLELRKDDTAVLEDAVEASAARVVGRMRALIGRENKEESLWIGEHLGGIGRTIHADGLTKEDIRLLKLEFGK